MRLTLFLLILYCLPVHGQKDDPKQKTIKLYDSIRNNAPREKLYVHFDKAVYTQTDTIWFKGYLIDASLNTASPLSGLIYTELINSSTGEVVQKLSLPTSMGLTWGSFALNPEKFKPGSYIFRAYTNWMQNFGDTYFYKKEFKIISLISEVVANTKKPDTALKQRLQDIDIQFLPEGGKWIVGLSQRMAFKAIDANGKGIFVKGEILDSKLNKIIEFQSNAFGMGYVNLLPTLGESYTAQVKYGGLIKNINLPKPLQAGTILQVGNHYSKDTIKVTVYSSTPSNQEITILGQSRGQLCFTSKIRFNTSIKFIYIPKSAFPTGVCQILVLDGSKMIHERNFFINHNDELNLNLSSTTTIYGTRDSIPLNLTVVDKIGKPVEGSFSIAVTDDNQVAKDSTNDETILSYLLLSSDLQGEIEEPGYYFHQRNEQKHNDLDALMLTQGWVSYDWDLNKKPLFKMEKEYAINGKVYGLLKRPIPNAKMTLLGKNKGMLMLNTIANQKGEFTFNDLPVMDSASFVIQAKNVKDKAGALTIEVDEFNPPKVSVFPKKMILTHSIDSIAKNFIATKKEEARLTFKDEILLNEVNIVGKKVIKGSKNLNGPGEADLVITEGELNKVAKKSLFELLQERIPGFRWGIKSSQHPKDFYLDSRLLRFTIDGMSLDFFYQEPDSYYDFIRQRLDSYQAEDIAGIELMKSFKYSFRYGDGGEGIFIEVTTRTGFGPFVKKIPNIYMYKPINYGDTKTFYHPRYTVANKTNKKPDFRSTLYWNPNLLTNEKGEGSFSFFSADKKGNYTVWIEGSDMQGNFGFKTMTLKIN